MAVPDTMNAAALVRKHLEADGGGDLLAGMIKAFADALLSSEADVLARWCGAAPVATSSGGGEDEPNRHRLVLLGNRTDRALNRCDWH